MKFGVLALDYDGTIAFDGMLDPEVRMAIADARTRGIITVLVTGRILSDLRHVMGDLTLFDAVVAENGAVLSFPNTGRSMALGKAPPPAFLQEIDRRGIKVSSGECVVEAEAAAAGEILPIIQELELPLVMVFNRGRLMILPEAISKATGLREAMTQLRRSEHNAIGIGDGENDHQLLAACEIGLAVGWGSRALKAAADGIIEGTDPSAVAGYIRHAVKRAKLPPNPARRSLLLGSDDNGEPMELAVTGRKVLITGDPQTGKSWITGILCEQMIHRCYSVCVVDPEGDYGTMESLPGVIVLGGDDPPPRVRDLTRALRNPQVSVVVDLSKMRPKDKREYVSTLLLMLAALRRDIGIPHHIVLDEAHYFLGDSDVTRLLDFELSSYTLVTYKAFSIHRDVLAAIEAVIVTRQTDPEETRDLRVLCGGVETEAEWEAVLGDLALGEAVLLPNAHEPGGHLRRFYPARRLTAHVRHMNKYLDVPVPEGQAFVFTRTGRSARTVKEFSAILASMPPDLLSDHLQNHDFSRWIAEIFRDSILASQIREIEASYLLGQFPDINDALMQVIQDRYKPPKLT